MNQAKRMLTLFHNRIHSYGMERTSKTSICPYLATRISSSSGFVFTLDRGTPPWIDLTGVRAWLNLDNKGPNCLVRLSLHYLSFLDDPVFWSYSWGPRCCSYGPAIIR